MCVLHAFYCWWRLLFFLTKNSEIGQLGRNNESIAPAKIFLVSMSYVASTHRSLRQLAAWMVKTIIYDLLASATIPSFG